MTRPRTLNSNAATEAWDDVYADVAQFERNEAERNKPQPVITPSDWQNIVTLACCFLMGCVMGGLVS
ncbi:hypothetical protein TomTYG75_06850 [Sphingobium sp. TomTYG75]